jgi:hypothetical protein
VADFLSSLIDRTFRREPVLQPRRPSLFESMPPITDAMFRAAGTPAARIDDWPTTDREDAAPRDFPPAHGAAPSRRRTAPTLPTTVSPDAAAAPPLEERAVSNHSTAGDMIDAVSRSASTRQASVTPLRRSAPRAQTSESDRDVVEPRIVEASAEPLATLVRSRVPPAPHAEAWDGVRSIAPSLDPRPPAAVVSRPSAQRDRDDEMHGERMPVSAPLAARAEVARSASPPALVPRSQPVPATNNRAIRSTPQTAAIPPTIQVTIGRVEIRATQPAAPPRSTRLATPRLGLDEYLRGRTGDRR